MWIATLLGSIERIAGDDCSAVEARRKHERVIEDPGDEGPGLRLTVLHELRPGFHVLVQELVGEIAVQVDAVGVLTTRAGPARPTISFLS